MTINPNLGYELGPGRSYNSLNTPCSSHLRELQYRAEQEILHRMGMTFYPEYKPQARTDMKEWVANLQDDFDRNQRRIEQLTKTDAGQSSPTPRQDIELMTTELHLRRALSEVLKQRMNTEAAKNK